MVDTPTGPRAQFGCVMLWLDEFQAWCQLQWNELMAGCGGVL